MKLTREMLVEAYRTYNKLKGYSKESFKTESIDFYLDGSDAKKGQLIGVLMYQKMKNQETPDKAYGSFEGELFEDVHMTIEEVELQENVDGPSLNSQQIESLENLMKSNLLDINSVDEILEDGTTTTLDKIENNKREDYNIEFKYVEGIDLTELFRRMNEPSLNRIYKEFKKHVDLGKPILDTDAIRNNPKLNRKESSQSTYESKRKSSYLSKKDHEELRINRKKELENEFYQDILFYIAAKKCYRELKEQTGVNARIRGGLSEETRFQTLEQELVHKYDFTKEDMEYLDRKIDFPDLPYPKDTFFIIPGFSREDSEFLKNKRNDPLDSVSITSPLTERDEMDLERERQERIERQRNLEKELEDEAPQQVQEQTQEEKDRAKLKASDPYKFCYSTLKDGTKFDLKKQFDELQESYSAFNTQPKPTGWQLIKRFKRWRAQKAMDAVESSLRYNGATDTLIQKAKNGSPLTSDFNSYFKKSSEQLTREFNNRTEFERFLNGKAKPDNINAREYMEQMAANYNEIKAMHDSYKPFDKKSKAQSAIEEHTLLEIKNNIKQKIDFSETSFEEVFQSYLDAGNSNQVEQIEVIDANLGDDFQLDNEDSSKEKENNKEVQSPDLDESIL